MNEDWKYTDKSLFEKRDVVKHRLEVPQNLAISQYLGMSRFKPSDDFDSMIMKNDAQGVYLRIKKNTEQEVPISIFANKKGVSLIHNMIFLEENSKLILFEDQKGSHGNINMLTEIFISANAKCEFYGVQSLEGDAKSLSRYEAYMGKDSSIKWAFDVKSAKFSRIKVDTYLESSGAEMRTYAMFTAKDDEHVDITTNSIHLAPHTNADILVRGIHETPSSSVYRGKIKISEEAQHTDSYLSDHTLLLCDNAKANSIPSLEIDADIVKASHGATIGKPDEEEIFYLMSRGLDRKKALNTLVKGFLSPVAKQFKKNGHPKD